MSSRVSLVVPSLEALAGYEAALASGWSPDNWRDVSAEQLAALRADARQFLHDLTNPNGTVRLADGRIVPRIPFHLFWIWDGEFCGRIDFRFLPGTGELPAHVTGHVGYAVVPWKRRRGYATEALTQILPIARGEGFQHIVIVCGDDNLPSRKVIEAVGGVFGGARPDPDRPGRSELIFHVRTDP